MEATYKGKNKDAQAYRGTTGQAFFGGPIMGWVFMPAQRAQGDTRQYLEFGVSQRDLEFTQVSDHYLHDMDSAQAL